MKPFLILSLIFSFVFCISPMQVNSETEFDMYLNDFYQKQEKASKILKEIETDLKDGNKNTACARQKEAANFGIQATESLIKAFKLNGTMTQLDYLQEGLDKWRELRDYC